MNAPLPTAAQRYSLAEIAEAIGVTKQYVQRRAHAEKWPFVTEPVRGGRKRFYAISDLPRAVARKISAYKAIKAVKAAVTEVPASFIMVVDGEVFEVRRIGS